MMTSGNGKRGHRVFLASDQIWPSAINASYPDARFVARARTANGGASVAPFFASVVDGDVWGVLIEVANRPNGSNAINVVTDEGSEVEAWIEPGDLLSGEPESVFMASRYWELDTAFIQELREALQAKGLETADEEPRDDGALDTSAPAAG